MVSTTWLFSTIQTCQQKWFYSLQVTWEIKHPLLRPFSRKTFCINGIFLLIRAVFLGSHAQSPCCGRLRRASQMKTPSLKNPEFRLSQGTTIGGKWAALELQQQWHTSFGLARSESCSVYCLGQSPTHGDRLPSFREAAAASVLYMLLCHTHG